MSISLTRILQQITGLNTFFAGPSASRDNGVVLLDTATVTWGTDGQGNIQATASGATLPTGSGNKVIATPANGSSGVSALRALVSSDLPVGSASQLGAVEVDGTTITAVAGVISAIPGAMVLIQEQTVSGTPAAITFSNIPQTYKHLKLIWSAPNTGNAGDYVLLQMNGVSSGYVAQAIVWTTGGSSAGGVGGFSQAGIAVGGSIGDATLQNYTSAAAVAQGSGYCDGSNYVTGGGFSGSAGPVTSLSLVFQNGTTWAAGGLFSLYGIS